MKPEDVFVAFKSLNGDAKDDFLRMLSLWCDIHQPDGDFVLVTKDKLHKHEGRFR